MSLQSQDLVMIGLGSEGHDLLADGVHLRWATNREKGFPWYGFHLFRRKHDRGELICLDPFLSGYKSGTTVGVPLTMPGVTLRSDRPLQFVDDFPPSGSVEITLRDREYLRVESDEPMRHVRLWIGQYEDKPIEARAFLGKVPVTTARTSGVAGVVDTLDLTFDAIDAVELLRGDGVLARICFVPVRQHAWDGWELLPDFPYPLCLPVAHPSYPCAGRPADRDAAWLMARDRIRRGDPDKFKDQPFVDLHDQLIKLVQGGPGSGMHLQVESALAVPTLPDPGLTPPSYKQYPLHLVLLGSLHPVIAQMVGLYWVDRTTQPGVAYDYLILGDWRLGKDPESLIKIGASEQPEDFDLYVHGYIVFNKEPEPTPALESPKDLKAYFLPGATIRTPGGGLRDARCNVGLRWDLGLTQIGLTRILLPDKPILYTIWRTDLPKEKPATPPDPKDFKPVGDDPTMVVESHLPTGFTPERSPNWPSFPLHFVDVGLKDGWYAYRVTGIDLFGRESDPSELAPWFDIDDVTQKDPWAIHLMDKLPPPTPVGLEAMALQTGDLVSEPYNPLDPTIVQDSVFNTWRDSAKETAWYQALSHEEKELLISLRVRWRWPATLARQAPDTKEFRIYFHSGDMNATPGRITNFQDLGLETRVWTNIPNNEAADAYVGTTLQNKGHYFSVVASEASSPLVLRVKNLTATPKVTVAKGVCSLAIPTLVGDTAGTISVVEGSRTVTGVRTNWSTHLVGMFLKVAEEPTMHTISQVDSPTQLRLDRDYSGHTGVGKVYTVKHPLFVDYRKRENWKARFYVVDVADHDPADSTLYEMIIPHPGDADRSGLPLAPDLAHPTAIGHIAVSAADDRAHTDDYLSPAEPWGGRSGNESPLSAPVKVFTVKQKPPPSPPPLPPDSPKVFASSANYHGHSYYTHRWKKAYSADDQVVEADNVRYHVFRAMGDSLFKVDWGQRPRGDDLSADQLQYFPVEWHGEEDDDSQTQQTKAAKRQQVADELNQLNSFSRDETGTTQAMAYYHELSNDALRVLAGLPGTERAFTQITKLPLDPTNSGNDDRLGPDSPADYISDLSLMAYIDTLPGRATNCYFYRVAAVDGANNRSSLSLSSVPVYLPNVVPPRAPVLVEVRGGDRQITLRWASNREPDMTEYQVYRAENEGAARDLRLMTQIGSVMAVHPPPAETEFMDDTLIPTHTYYYRLVAVDEAGNVSDPTSAVGARAYDHTRPAPPTWTPPVSDPGTNTVNLSWTAADPQLRCLIQRHLAGETAWANLGGWLERGTYTYTDAERIVGQQYVYRLRVMDVTGRLNRDFSELIV